MNIGRKIKRFYLGNIRKELKSAVQNLSRQVEEEFPKKEERWLSHYVYREFKIHIDSNGSIKGGLLRLIFSLVDFSFVRSLVADCYSKEGGDCYDPVTLLLLEVMIEMVKKKDPEAKLEDIGAFDIIKLHLVKGNVPAFEKHRKYVNEVFGGSVMIPEGYSVELISNSVSKPDGYDYGRKALKNTCGKQCLQCKNASELPECEYRENKQGYTKRMLTKDLPRLILEVPRGSRRYKKIKAIRSSSERMNSYGKEWTGISNLRLWGLNAYAVRVALCCIVMMLKKVMEFILRATVEHTNPALAEKSYHHKLKRKLKNCA